MGQCGRAGGEIHVPFDVWTFEQPGNYGAVIYWNVWGYNFDLDPWMKGAVYVQKFFFFLWAYNMWIEGDRTYQKILEHETLLRKFKQ